MKRPRLAGLAAVARVFNERGSVKAQAAEKVVLAAKRLISSLI